MKLVHGIIFVHTIPAAKGAAGIFFAQRFGFVPGVSLHFQ